jgi:hypothetical protein
MTDEMPIATSQYLNTPVRSLDEARAAREPHDAGIPSDSPYSWTDIRPIYRPSDPRYLQSPPLRMLSDAETDEFMGDGLNRHPEPDMTFDQQRAAKRQLFLGVVWRLLALAAAGYILTSAWSEIYPLHVRLAVPMEHGFEGVK